MIFYIHEEREWKNIYMKCGVRHPWSSSGCQVAEMWDMAKALLLLLASVRSNSPFSKGVRSDRSDSAWNKRCLIQSDSRSSKRCLIESDSCHRPHLSRNQRLSHSFTPAAKANQFISKHS